MEFTIRQHPKSGRRLWRIHFPMSLRPEQQLTLIGVAQDAIVHGLKYHKAPTVNPTDYDEALRAIHASFVTLHIGDQLRGCIGGLEATQPVVVDVAEHAFAAAFSDPRFPPLREDELSPLRIHISILSPKTSLQFASEEDLKAQLRPGLDGLLIAKGARRATFLPTVWESLSEPGVFLRHLKQKAGIPENVCDYVAWRYTTEGFPE